MRILVTGGAGFIGTNFSLLAESKGHSVTVLDNFSRKGVEENAKILKEKSQIKIEKLDIRNPLPAKLGKYNAIVHLAASCSTPVSFEDPYSDFLDNALGTLNVLEFARKKGKIPVIYASTCKVYTSEINTWPISELKKRYSFKKIKGVDENAPLLSKGVYSRSPYGNSKYTGDLYCLEYFISFGVPTVVNRMSTIFGKYQQGSVESGWIYWFIKAKKQNLPVTIFGNGKQVRDALWGEDVVRLFLDQIKNIKKHQGQIYNVGGGPENSISILELVNYLNKKQGKPLKPSFAEVRPGDFKVYISDISKITKNSRWKPKVPVYEGIDTLWEKKNS